MLLLLLLPLYSYTIFDKDQSNEYTYGCPTNTTNAHIRPVSKVVELDIAMVPGYISKCCVPCTCHTSIYIPL